jgi:ribonuclease Z
MRVIACGTGMPQPRLKQAAACFLVELGNGDKFVFDMGEGSFERLTALGIPLDQLDKVFLGHLHLDHAGDFPAFWLTRGVNAGRTPIRLWGVNGVKPEWGTKSWADKIHEAWAWEVASRGSAIDPRGIQIEVTEFDWKAINNVVYEENDVVIRTLPAIHVDQSVSFILEWNGLKFAFSSDTLPNKWWIEHTKGVDLSIHECVLPPELWVDKYSFDPAGAVYAATQAHTHPSAFGKIMSMTNPRHAVAYHFQNDFDTGPVVEKAIRMTYDGPLDLAQDFMVWNVSKDAVRTRMAVPNEERFPEPAQRPAVPQKGADGYKWDPLNFEGVERETSAVINERLKEFNEKYGTNVEPTMTGIPFKDDER